MSLEVRASVRIEELGCVGLTLSKHLKPEDYATDLSATEQFYYVSLIAKKHSKLRAAAYSVLLCDYTTQVMLSQSELLSLLNVSYLVEEVKNTHYRGVKYDVTKNRWLTSLKSHPGATNKVNVYFSEIMLELKKKDRRSWDMVVREQWRLGGLYDDQCSALVLYYQSLVDVYGDSALDIATVYLHYPKVAKAFSTIVKSLGVNGTYYGSMLCEGQTLQGRAVGVIDFEEEVGYRLDTERVKEKTVPFDYERLRVVVRSIIQKELVEKPEFDSVDDYWSKRWLWCVNGAHGNALGRLKPMYRVNFRKRMHRRVFAENLEHEPISSWDGTTLFTMSEKLEHGKTRAIFGGDSVSYFCFDHLLRNVEKVWRGRRVVLDPGRGGSIGMAERVEKLKGAWHVMLDYDDFNSQHTLDSQAIVIDELVKASGYDQVLGGMLTESIYNQFIVVDGKPVRLAGTLMSGHRATTVINSILNFAYVLYASPMVERQNSVHVGDDIYIKVENAACAVQILNEVASIGIRMNPLKQSVGVETAEFLRHASGRDGSYGYVARSISSIISGNWESESRLGAEEFVNSVLQSSWTIMNRSRSTSASLLARSFNRYTGLPLALCRAALLGKASVNGSPVRGKNWCVPTLSVKEVDLLSSGKDVVSEVVNLGGERYATSAYQRLHISPVEVIGIQEAGVDLNRMMIESSYRKTVTDGNTEISGRVQIKYTGDKWRPVGAVDVMALRSVKKARGALVSYPMLMLIKDRLSSRVIVDLLRSVNIMCPEGMDVREFAFGEVSKARMWVIGAIPYSDVKTFSVRDETGVYAIRQRYF